MANNYHHRLLLIRYISLFFIIISSANYLYPRIVSMLSIRDDEQKKSKNSNSFPPLEMHRGEKHTTVCVLGAGYTFVFL